MQHVAFGLLAEFPPPGKTIVPTPLIASLFDRFNAQSWIHLGSRWRLLLKDWVLSNIGFPLSVTKDQKPLPLGGLGAWAVFLRKVFRPP